MYNYQLLNLKDKLNEPAEQKQYHRYGDHLDGYQLGGSRGRMGEKVQELRSTYWQVQNRQGDVKKTVGNRVAKELVCITHGHEISQGRNGQREWECWIEQGNGVKTGATVIA